MYKVFDLETETHEEYKRKASPFCEKNWIVARGWKNQGDKQCSWEYFPQHNRKSTLVIEDHITYLVGFNIKFDLLWELCQGNKSVQAFFKRGGQIWDGQYAEYLLEAQSDESQMCALTDTAPKYGGTRKIDAVKELWEAGVHTADIPEDLLIDYLVGTEEENRNGGDIRNTELVFLGQIAKATERGMLKMIQDRMWGLVSTTYMEYSGVKIDVKEAAETLGVLSAELKIVQAELDEYIPKDLPFTFNWGSGYHASYIIFGGTAKYEKQAPYKDENGEWARKKATASWLLFNGIAIDPVKYAEYLTVRPSDGLHVLTVNGQTLLQDRYVSGAKKGSGKYKKVDIPGDIKVKYQDFLYDFPGYTKPRPEWAGERKDGKGEPIYSTAADVITALAHTDIPFLKAVGRRQALDKDIGTYYVKVHPETGKMTGMLTCVRTDTHIINHKLNHNLTVTTRLSSSDPNLQNLSRGDKSRVKAMFVSRFEGGQMLEVDYSQLEVVVQGVLSQDPNLMRDLINRIDFHCKRVSAKFGCTYEEALEWCKNEEYPDFKLWKSRRTGVKEFSFQRAYGAGAQAISDATGMPVEDIKLLIETEEAMYPGIVTFNSNVEAEVKKSAVPFQAPSGDYGPDGKAVYKTYRRGQYQAPTGTLYSFRTINSPAFLQKRGIKESFNPPELKNYPVQGTGGEFVQAMCGELIKHFIKNDFYDQKAFLVNTVHDCVWADTHPSVTKEVAADMQRIMESIPEFYNKRHGMNIIVPFPVEAEVGDNMYKMGHLH